LVAAAVGFLALESGGFFATSWGWPALVCVVTAAVVVAQVDRVRVARLDLVLLGALGAYVGWTALSALWAPGAELPLGAAAVALVIVLPTLYFTFSRGAVAVLVLGVVVAAALERERLRFTLTSLAALPLPLVGVWLASRSRPLTRAGAPLASAARDGHRV